MAIFTSDMALRAVCFILLLFSRGSDAQSTSPSNDTTPFQGVIGFLMSTTLNNMATSIKVVPLTNNAGLSGSTQQLQSITPSGPLFLANPGTVNDLSPGDIAYISCEPSDYNGQIDAPRDINFAVNNRPVAIVLYSEYSARCQFTPSDEFSYTSMYTTEDANSSSAVLKGLNAASPRTPNTSIHVDLSTINGTNSGGTGGNVLGKSPTTAVAMIILYSITGIITALFLIIIIVGAIRAHRHPERYGPRRIVGRPRQSRAKGIARAMLETLPIVKFGELEEDNKPANQQRDMEMGVTNPEHVEDAAATPQNLPKDDVEGSNVEAKDDAEGSNGEPREESETEAHSETTEPSAIEAATPQPDNTIETGTAAVDNGLACSVCVEDFEKGQDVRVLPCKHRFHPECIDPWLLNVSGTCPLCRVDLRPTASHSSNPEDIPSADPAPPAPVTTTSTDDAATTAAFNESTRRNRRSRILHTLNIGRMRTATPEERLAALRMLRNEQMIGGTSTSTTAVPSGASTPRSRNRFSQRLSRTFGSSRPHSGAGTPRRNSGRTSPVAEAELAATAHGARGMESTAEEATAEESTATEEIAVNEEVPANGEAPVSDELSPIVSTMSAADLGQAQMAGAPHAAGAAHVVDVTTSRSGSPHEHAHPEGKESQQLSPQSRDQPADAEPSTTAPLTPSASHPDIAPFYSYR